jgi:predicted MFS family arabinose efflux permease
MENVSVRALRLPVAGAAFLALADTAIVALALPPILRELDTDVAGVAAVLGVYAVVLAAALPVAEWLRRAAGARPVGAGGVALFVLGSIVCGVSGSLALLLVARGVQAAGGAALLVTAYALLADGGAGQRIWRLAALLGTAAGPAIGGALTQALGWRSIFLLQAPAGLAALPGCLTAPLTGTAPRAARRPPPAASAPAPTCSWLPRAVALGLVSGAVAVALFLTVLLLISGWGIEPLAAAAAVSIMPLTALVATLIQGSSAVRAAGGCLLVAAGTASLAFLPNAAVGWTVVPQLAVGAGMGLALSALAGDLLPERSGRDAARLLSVRHVGIAFALLLLAPIAQHELNSTLEKTRERGAALILDARLDPRVKLEIAPQLAESVETEDPRGGLEKVFADGRGDVDGDELDAYDDLTRSADETLVVGVNDGFATAFLLGAALALVAAAILAPTALAAAAATGRRPLADVPPRAAALGLVSAAVLATGGFALATQTVRPELVQIADPCQDRDVPGSGGVTGFLQDAALVALDHIACRAGSSREELVLALVDDEAAKRYEERYGIDPRSALDLAKVALPG